MKKILPIVIILIVLAFLPSIVSAAQNGKGTGVFSLDLVLFTLLPFIVIALLMHFLFKLPSEISPYPARASAVSMAASKEIPAQEARFEEISAVEPEIAVEPEVTCPECGGLVTLDIASCPHCGVKFEKEEGAGEVVEAEPAAELEPAVELPSEEIVMPTEEKEPEAMSLELPEEAPKEEEMGFGLKCPTCGGNVGIEEKFCPHCGADFEEKELAEKEPAAEKSEEELDKLFGIAPEETKQEVAPEKKPVTQGPDEIVISYDEPEEEPLPTKSKKGKKKK